MRGCPSAFHLIAAAHAAGATGAALNMMLMAATTQGSVARPDG